MTGVRLVLCSVPEEHARVLADALLGANLVACVSFLGPVTSRYVWKGAVEDARETLLLMKTSAACTAALRARIVAMHSYEVPEIIELPVDGGHAPYLQWVVDTCAASL